MAEHPGLGKVPTWVWVVGGGAVAVFAAVMFLGKSGQTSSSTGVNSPSQTTLGTGTVTDPTLASSGSQSAAGVPSGVGSSTSTSGTVGSTPQPFAGTGGGGQGAVLSTPGPSALGDAFAWFPLQNAGLAATNSASSQSSGLTVTPRATNQAETGNMSSVQAPVWWINAQTGQLARLA